MDYLYENLNDERFQELCQAIIVKEFPNSQVFPIGQPDGGRDSLVYTGDHGKKAFTVFQIKFVRNPYQIEDVHKWLVKTIDGELEKINKLIPDGAKGYYLLTNVKGTGHLKNGSIDKLNKVLEEAITIPAYCWWRDDLSRRLESNTAIKWSYPEILNGQDILNSNIFQHINENRERRENVIRAYLVDQYDLDNEVKFKQIELQNHLLDLFIDVPIRLNRYNEKNKALRQLLYHFNRGWHINKVTIVDDIYETSDNGHIGTAQFLLSSSVQKNITRILIEGGPGQGKSTISQYVCQVHRIRLLNKTTDLSSVPELLHNTPVRLPLKIDLRDIASWLEKRNPYPSSISEEHFSRIWHKSLEAFIVGHIFYHSKLEDFTTNDFVAICRHSAVLIVFDGFDEIANIKLREEVIEFINKGINRIEENSASLQVIITSRPAAFSSSVGFSTDIYPHFELTDVTPSIRKEYVEKWIKSRRLGSREASEIRKLVDEKLEQPHLKDLAKSPMQLAILISLLNTRGESLPNKRTALYDSYIELFFNRESEKSFVIRDNRDLIIDIHQYLAWILHSEAEMFQNNGRIELDDLKKRLKFYLDTEGHKTDIADRLFDVVKERVCALVSRVQGTFEFEVQPLREYFCAKYLYKTSPYSPPGNEKTGTKAERFDAISRNLYWQNVVRFFAGCFDKGELPLIMQKLNELQDDPLLKYTNHPQILTAQLLSDWVFTQYPLYLKDVVKIILLGISAGSILNQQSKNANNDPIQLPVECGRNEVEKESFNQLKKFPTSDYASELIGVINNNSNKKVELWMEHASELKGEKLTNWLEYAYYMQIIYRLDERLLTDILKEDKRELKRRLKLLIDGNKFDLCDRNLELKELIFRGILNAEMYFHPRRYKGHSFNFLSFVSNTYVLSAIFEHRYDPYSLLDIANNRMHYIDSMNENRITEFDVNDIIDQKIQEFYNASQQLLNERLSHWKVDIKPWEKLVYSFQRSFGECWIPYLISIIAAAIKSKEAKFDDHEDLDDDSKSLCKRVRNARLKSGNITWWRQTLNSTKSIEFTTLVCLTWCTPKTLIELYPSLIEKFDDVNGIKIKPFVTKLKKVTQVSLLDSMQQKLITKWLSNNKIDCRFIYLLSFRFPEQSRGEFIYKFLKNYDGDVQEILKQKLDYLLYDFLHKSHTEAKLNEIRNVYSKIKRYDNQNSRYRTDYQNHLELPIELAKSIMKEFKQYPESLAVIAERICRRYAYKQNMPVGEIAKAEKWFD